MTSDHTARATYLLAFVGIVFQVIFWAVTNRVEPTFVVLFGSILTGGAILDSRKAPKLPPEKDGEA